MKPCPCVRTRAHSCSHSYLYSRHFRSRSLSPLAFPFPFPPSVPTRAFTRVPALCPHSRRDDADDALPPRELRAGGGFRQPGRGETAHLPVRGRLLGAADVGAPRGERAGLDHLHERGGCYRRVAARGHATRNERPVAVFDRVRRGASLPKALWRCARFELERAAPRAVVAARAKRQGGK